MAHVSRDYPVKEHADHLKIQYGTGSRVINKEKKN